MQKHLPPKLTKLDSQETWHIQDSWEQIQKVGLLLTRCFSKYVANDMKGTIRISEPFFQIKKSTEEYRQRADGTHKLSKILKGEILQLDKVVAVYIHFRQHPAICIVFPWAVSYPTEALLLSQIGSSFLWYMCVLSGFSHV